VPCLDLFLEQDETYINEVIGHNLPKVAVEAGIRQGWEGLINRGDSFVGMNSFGASAPGNELFNHFDITTDEIIRKARKMLDL